MRIYHCKRDKNGAPFIPQERIEKITDKILRKYCPDALKNLEPINLEDLVEFDLGFPIEYAYLSNNGCYSGRMVFNDSEVIPIMKNLYTNPKTREYELEYLMGRKDTVLIDKSLEWSNNHHYLRFTIAHEAGHGILHPCVYYKDENQVSFFQEDSDYFIAACRPMDLQPTRKKAWTAHDTIEWQANTFASSLLMNKTAVHSFIENLGYKKYLKDPFYQSDLVEKVSEQFDVSKTAAMVRLKVLQYLPRDYEISDHLIFQEFEFD